MNQQLSEQLIVLSEGYKKKKEERRKQNSNRNKNEKVTDVNQPSSRKPKNGDNVHIRKENIKPIKSNI